ncbi:MAG: hypothetical protein JW884_12615, partial [Deltaproteobacteria bacterium]|nr:hypothetical protein [Deltaproteobacteria bacterium]
MAGQTEEAVIEKARTAFPEILHILTAPADVIEREYRGKTMPAKGKIRHKSIFGFRPGSSAHERTVRAPESLEGTNRYFYASGWTDGLPIIPPTEERLNAMIAASGWDPGLSLGLVAPMNGEATVEKIAVNAIMAGCGPDHLPVVIAATKAMIEERFNLYALQTTTHLCTVLVVANGPVAEDLGINCSYNAMGQGSLANAVIGRAVRFILMNIGGALPGILDRSTFGSPAKYTFCFAENEEESPWEPLHVERGFDPHHSAVTVVGAEGPHNVNDHGSASAEEVLLTVSGVLAT